jgi:hypothetical protein
MRGAKIRYSEAELAWIEARQAMPRADLHAAFKAAFGRPDVSFENLRALCKRCGWLTGRDGRYHPGQTPLNKGERRPGCTRGSKTWFKPGTPAPNAHEVGQERVRGDGYVEVMVAETNPYTGAPRRYVLKHRVAWEAENGPLPTGHVLKSLDGDRKNTCSENWVAVPRGLLPRLNGRFGRNYDVAAPELRPTLLAISKLEHAAREARHGRKP